MYHNNYMYRCLQLAQHGLGRVSPNPMVGAVIVFNDRIIGEGFHRLCGQAHAEVNAIDSVADKSLLCKSTMYVSLEPCSHHGKTPPCADLIIECRIPKVVVGCVDTFSQVQGRGIEKLRRAGVEVVLDVLADECRELNRRFFTFHEKKRPYVILKWAQTLDGYIDACRLKDTPVQPLWITNEASRVLVHRWRAEEDAIMVGTNTAEKDNPKLNIRDWYGKNPLRVLIDRDLRLSQSLHLFDQSVPTIVFTEKKQANQNNVEYCQISFNETLLDSVFDILHQRNVQSIIIEGGTQLINTFIDANAWDEARVFIGDKLFYNGVHAPQIGFNYSSKIKIGGSSLYYYRNK